MQFKLNHFYTCTESPHPRRSSGASRETKFECVASGLRYALLYFDGRVCGAKETTIAVEHSNKNWVEVPDLISDHLQETWRLLDVVERKEGDRFYGELGPKEHVNLGYCKKYIHKTEAIDILDKMIPGSVPSFVKTYLKFEQQSRTHVFFSKVVDGVETEEIYSLVKRLFHHNDWYEIVQPEKARLKGFVYDVEFGEICVFTEPMGCRHIAQVDIEIPFIREKNVS